MCTIDSFEEPFRALLGVPSGPGEPPPLSFSQPAHVAWRSLPLTRRPLHTGLGRAHGVDDGSLRASAGFFTQDVSAAAGVSRMPGAGDVEAAWTQFCKQSLAEHNSIMPPGQLDDSLDSEDIFSMTATSASELDQSRAMPPPPVSLHLSDLDDVPPAKRIVALQPQTVTLNLLVGVISVAQPRTVTTCWGQALSLVEVLVGDDTAAGFAVTFWLSSDSAAESSLVGLRRQDVVLMENVALHVFRGKVYGQSLRKGLTRVHLLWRRDGSGHYSTRSLDAG